MQLEIQDMTRMEWFWPYLIIVGTLFFTGIGLPPLPEELPIIAAGITASHADLEWYLAWPACILGVLLADLALYGMGRLGGPKLMQSSWARALVSPERFCRLSDGFHRHGLGLLLTGRLLPGLRTGVFLSAGAVQYPFWRFILADALYALPGVALVFFGSYFLAETFSHWFEEVDRVRHWIVLVVLGGGTMYAAFKLVRCWRRRRESSPEEAGPVGQAVAPPLLSPSNSGRARPAA